MMIDNVVWLLTGCMITLATMQIVFVIWYLRIMKQQASEPTAEADADRPSVAVILCLRGPDPALPDCLRGLCHLNYPDYQLHLVIDHPNDPVVNFAQQIISKLNHDRVPDIHWHTVADRSESRSLKCSALITAILALPAHIEVVALVDADAAVTPNWLTQLTDPLADDRVGVTTGNRWFEPIGGGLGARVRAAWNAAALPQMSIYQIPWGGSLAIKSSVIRDCNLLDRWSNMFCEDTILTDALKPLGLRVKRVPDLILVNQESTSLVAAASWIRRQLLTVRLYHRLWPMVLSHALLGGFCFFAPLLLMFMAPLYGSWLIVWCVFAWLMQLVVNIGLLTLITNTNRRTVTWSPPLAIARQSPINQLITTLTLQALYPFLAIAAAIGQRVEWRGVEYRISRGSKIEMIEYRPFTAAGQQPTDHSI